MENNSAIPNHNDQVDYLSGLEDPFFQMEEATPGQRFANFLIDNLLMRYGISILTGMLIGTVLSAISQGFLYEARKDVWGFIFLSFLVGCINYMIYYTLCEKLFKGYTLGKLVTGTRAVNENGSELTFKSCLARSLCRLIPFEPLSGFSGHPWHDTLSHTIVIKTR